MDKEKDKHLDNLFRNKLGKPLDEVPYEPADWDALEQMLDKNKKRKSIVYLMPILIGIAAMMFVFFGIWFFLQPGKNMSNGQKGRQLVKNKPAVNKDQQKVVPVNTNTLPATAKNNLTKTNNGIGSGTSLTPAPPIYKQPDFSQKPDGNLFVKNNDQNNKINSPVNDEKGITIGKIDSLKNNAGDAIAVTNTGLANNTAPKTIASIAQTTDSAEVIKKASQKAMVAGNKVNIKKRTSFTPQFSLTVLGARDENGVGSFQQSMTGTKAGALFSVGISKRFTITTGTVYSSTPYSSSFANYHFPYPISNTPESVSANCKMLDIPLNIGYQVYHKQRNRFSVGTGLSSYIMLNQSFKFNYGYGSSTGSPSYNYSNNEKYLFSIFNINATYERQINSKVGLAIQPYLKLPLTNVGYSQVKLQTTGVAVGLSWNLNSQKQ